MNLPTSVVITGCESMENLAQAIKAAKTFRPLEATVVAALLAKTDAAARLATLNSTKPPLNSTAQPTDPQWLG
jgi:hypothetical protein